MQKIQKSLKDYILSRCVWVGECLVWQGAKPRGYGVFALADTGRKQKLAHRTLYEIEHGELPANVMVMHTCDNPACCNIDHLKAGSAKENAEDCSLKGRKRHNGMNPKLSKEDREKIKELSSTHSDRQLAEMFGVYSSTIYRVKKNVTTFREKGEVARLAANKRWAAHRTSKKA